jgi:hypothetical protein
MARGIRRQWTVRYTLWLVVAIIKDVVSRQQSNRERFFPFNETCLFNIAPRLCVVYATIDTTMDRETAAVSAVRKGESRLICFLFMCL